MARQTELSFAERLVALQTEKRLTNDELSRRARISLRLLQKYRNGTVEPRNIWGEPSENAKTLARELGVAVGDLVPPRQAASPPAAA